jgi:hypothetical protein
VGSLGVELVERETQVEGHSGELSVAVPWQLWVDEEAVVSWILSEVLNTLGQRTCHHMPSLLQ